MEIEDCVCIRGPCYVWDCPEVIKSFCKEHPGYMLQGNPVWDSHNYHYYLIFIKYKENHLNEKEK